MRVQPVRIAGGFLIIGLALSCGEHTTPGPPDPTPVTINYLRTDNPPYARADDAVFGDYLAQHPEVTLFRETVRYPSLTATLNSDLKTNRLSSDLVRMPPSWVCSFADNLADVPDDIISLAEARQVFFPAPLAGSVCSGKLKGLPIEYNLEYGGVVVNLDKYEARYPGRSPGWADWGTFIREAAELTEYDAAGQPAANGLDIAPDWPQPVKHIFFSQILQRGGRYWVEGNNAFDFSSPEAVDSLTEMVNWVVRDKVMFPSIVPRMNTFVTTRLVGGATGYGWNDPSKPLAVMGYAGTWAVANVVAQLPAGSNLRYAFQALPPMVGNQHKFVQNSGFALVVPKTSKNQKAAWDIARAIALVPEGSRRWTTIGGALPALRVNGTREAAAGDPTLAKVQPLLEHGTWVGFIPAASIETVEGTILRNFFDAVSGTKTVAQALADMERTANEALTHGR
jgi:multiple sugar transport system substrate-binding protein